MVNFDDHDIVILNHRHLRGPNMWSYYSSIEVLIDIGDLEDYPSNLIPGFYTRMTHALPSLQEHRCSYEVAGGFLMRVQEGTWAGHILEHLTIELQNLAGIKGGYGRARDGGGRGIYKVIVSATEENVTFQAFKHAKDLLLALIKDKPNITELIQSSISNLCKMRNDYLLDQNTSCLVEAATAREIPFIRHHKSDLVQFGYGANQRRIHGTLMDQTCAVAQSISNDLVLTQRQLETVGLPTLRANIISSPEEAWRVAQKIGLPVTLKPVDDLKCQYIFTNLQSKQEVEAAYNSVIQIGKKIIIERHVQGFEYQVLVVGTEVVAAAQKTLVWTDVSQSIHPDVARDMVLSAKTIGFDIAAVDLIANDIGHPLDALNSAVIKINPAPNFGAYLNPVAGEPQPIAKKIIDHIFPKDIELSVPIVGISGSYGKSEVAKTISFFLAMNYLHIGLSIESGLFYNGKLVEDNNATTWENARSVLMNQSVQIAIIENDNKTLLLEGLPYEQCQIGIVLNIDKSDLFPEYYIVNEDDLFKIIRTQVDVVLPTGACILNADDEMIVKMAELCKGEIIYFSCAKDSAVITEHQRHGGRSLIFSDEWIVLLQGVSEVLSFKLQPTNKSVAPCELPAPMALAVAMGVAWALEMQLSLLETAAQSLGMVCVPNQSVNTSKLIPMGPSSTT